MRPELAGLIASPARSISTGLGAGEAADGAVLDDFGNGSDRFEITFAGDRKSGFDNVDFHQFQRARDTNFFVARHRCAGALLAVPKGGVEYD